MAEKFTCPICGEPTRVYMGNARKDRLCGKHADELKAGKLEQCPDCQSWHETGKTCSCKETKPQAKKADNSNNEITCIVCEQPSNGKHFCISCYHKYKNKVLYLQIKNCNEFHKLDAEYESEFTCDDGHMVKSPYEKIIDNWLFQEGIQHAYEKKIDISKEQDITPDFYIPEYKDKNGNVLLNDVYIEFWGYDETNVKYQKTKEYKLKIYPELCKKEKITVIYLNKKEVENDSYKKKIKYAEQGKVNE